MSNPRFRPDPGAPQSPKQEETENFLQARMRNVGDAFGAVDDFYMGAGRNLLGLPKQGLVPEDGFAPGIRNAGGLLFAARPGATDVNKMYQYEDTDLGGKAAIFANRAAHAGGLTAAGVGLAHLTGAIVNQFGGPADQPTDSQLYM